MKKSLLIALSLTTAAISNLYGNENTQILKDLKIPAQKQIFTDMFKLEKGKKIEFSGKAFSEKAVEHIAMEVRFFDINKRIIHPHLVNALKGSEAKLVKPAQKGEKSFIIADNPLWQNYKKYRLAAFNAQADMSDLPNRFCEYYVSNVEKTSEGLQVTLSRPLSRNYPADMQVRLHGDAGWMRFKPSVIGASAKGVEFKLAAEWADAPGHNAHKLWEGAVWARVFCKSKSNCDLKDMKVTAVDTAAVK